MFLAQLAAAMVVWAILVVRLFRRREELIATMKARSRGERAVQAIVRLFASIALLALEMIALSKGGMVQGSFTLWGWALTTVVVPLFAYLQTTALVPLILNSVTQPIIDSSDSKDADHP